MAKNDPKTSREQPNGAADDLQLDDAQEFISDEPELLEIDMAIVLISRDSTTTTPTTVFAAEIPILEAIHGEEAVSVHQEYTGQTKLNAAEIHAQLLAKYRQHTDEVKSVYPTPRAVQRATGLSYTKGDSQLAKPKQSSVLVGGKEVKSG